MLREQVKEPDRVEDVGFAGCVGSRDTSERSEVDFDIAKVLEAVDA
jgi:hypothetical protein